MMTLAGVLGVLGMCGAGFGNPTQIKASKFKGYKSLWRVCWVYARAHAYARSFFLKLVLQCPPKKLYAKAEKPNKPNTPHSTWLSALNLKGLMCVGFVLGMGFFVLGSVLGQKA